jgi:hypothetical protein
MHELEDELIRTTAMLLSLEKWASQYNKSPEQHAQLITQATKFQLGLVKFFKSVAKKASDYANWDQYNYQVSKNSLTKRQLDYAVDVIVNDDQIDYNDSTFIKVNLQPIQNMIVTGAQSGEPTYGIPLTESTSSASYQKLALNKTAAMVGKQITKDGQIIDNPNPDYNIMNTVRDDIAQSIETSLALGETTDEAITRMEEIIANPDRAELIAQTESVNAYNIGVSQYGNDSGAVGKEWESSNPDDICAENASEGPIPIDSEFPSGDTEPGAHPRCMCAERLIYQEEWDREGYGGN